MPDIQQIIPAAAQVAPYQTFSARVDWNAQYDNPFDYDEVAVEVQLEGPTGKSYDVDGFFQPGLVLDPATGTLRSDVEDGFAFRFTPDGPGTWRYTVRVTDGAGTSEPIAGQFDCVGTPANSGFVRRVKGNYLQKDDGTPYVPIGENLAWSQGDPFQAYRQWLRELSAAGGNYLRLWHAHWGLGIEWKKDDGVFGGLRRYSARNLAYLDWLFDHGAASELRILLTLHHHGPVSTKVDPEWGDNPHNLIHGGPCRHSWEFFTNATAKAHTRNRLRYCVARWGHSPALLAWELFNEVDWTDDYAKHRAAVSAWHVDMATFLKDIDPYGHLVTTSYAKAQYEPEVWNCPSIDFTQTHHYQQSDNLERALVNRTRNYLTEYGKPCLNAEFGLGGKLDLATVDPTGVHLHNALWATLFGGGLGAGMSWWWDTYVHPCGLFRQFTAVRAVSDRIPFLAAGMAPTPAFITGAPAALTLTPTLGWGEIGSDTVEIDGFGNTQPTTAELSRYLYGKRWNRQYRCPPTFRVHCPSAGRFSVQTGNSTGRRPRLQITVDGVRCLRMRAEPDRQYSIELPAGDHTVQVDNVGRDWISVAGYHWSGIGSALDPYVLRAENGRGAAGWLLNNRYHYRQLATGQVPAPVIGAELRLPNFVDVEYTISWFDCQRGALTQQVSVTATEGVLAISVPPVAWDVAFVVDERRVLV